MKNTIYKESGRSMVEMLGVLAVIGVLSVGGVSGYKMAMEQHKLNTIFRLIDLYALSVQEATNKDTITGYDGNNAHSTCYCKATQYFCDGYLGSSCGSFTTDYPRYKKDGKIVNYPAKQYNGILFYSYSAQTLHAIALTIIGTSAQTCKKVIEYAHANAEKIGIGGTNPYNHFRPERWEEALDNCDTQAEKYGSDNVVIALKFAYSPLEAEDLFNCAKLYPNACDQ